MAVETLDRALLERVLNILGDADVAGVAAVEDARGTPLFASAVQLLPEARSIVVVGMEIFGEIAGLVAPGKELGTATPGDLYQPHLDYLHGQLNRLLYNLAKACRAAGYRAIPLPGQGTPNDARFQRAILSFKHAAEYAGLGSIGRSSLLLTPRFGPRQRLACLLTDAPLPPTPRVRVDTCSSCPNVCIENCPSGALSRADADQPYAINKFACAAFRSAAGGCATCLSMCTAGAK